MLKRFIDFSKAQTTPDRNVDLSEGTFTKTAALAAVTKIATLRQQLNREKSATAGEKTIAEQLLILAGLVGAAIWNGDK
jgi:hypothetical protein